MRWLIHVFYLPGGWCCCQLLLHMFSEWKQFFQFFYKCCCLLFSCSPMLDFHPFSGSRLQLVFLVYYIFHDTFTAFRLVIFTSQVFLKHLQSYIYQKLFLANCSGTKQLFGKKSTFHSCVTCSLIQLNGKDWINLSNMDAFHDVDFTLNAFASLQIADFNMNAIAAFHVVDFTWNAFSSCNVDYSMNEFVSFHIVDFNVKMNLLNVMLLVFQDDFQQSDCFRMYFT